jgi:Zinc finger, C3HC4 type (RING finger)
MSAEGSTLIVFKEPDHLARFKDAMSIDTVEHLTGGVEKHESKPLYMIASTDAIIVASATSSLPTPKRIAYIFTASMANQRTRHLHDNEFEIRTAEMLADLIPVTDQEVAKLNDRLFNYGRRPATAVIEMTPMQLATLFMRGRQVSLSPTKKKIPEAWQKRLRTDEPETLANISADDNRCIICCEDRPRSVLFDPCGHVVCCKQCATTMMENKSQCPVCREPVENIHVIKR